MVTALQSLVTRQFDVFDPVVITVGSFHAGTADNVIPDEIYDPRLRAVVEAKLPPLGAFAVRADAQAAESGTKPLSNTEIFVAAVVVFLIVSLMVIALMMKFAK